MKKKLLLIFSFSLCIQPSWAQDLSLNGFERVDHVPGGIKEDDFREFGEFPVDEINRSQEEKDLVSSNHYNRLRAEELRERLIGSTVYGLTAKKKPYAIYFQDERRMPTLMEDGRFEVGKWDVDDAEHRITSQWPTLHDGKPIRVEYHESKDRSHLLKVNPYTKKYTVMVLKKGDPEELAKRRELKAR